MFRRVWNPHASLEVAYVGETRARSWVKSLVWRAIGVCILGGIGWLVTSDWKQTTVITIIFHLVRFVFYYYHERIWGHIEWGKVRANNGEK